MKIPNFQKNKLRLWISAFENTNKIPVYVKKKMREKVYFYIMLWAMKRGPLDI